MKLLVGLLVVLMLTVFVLLLATVMSDNWSPPPSKRATDYDCPVPIDLVLIEPSEDELMYTLRSCDMYAPWLRNIFVTETSVDWIKSDRVKFVHAAERCLHKIEGLSEHFIVCEAGVLFARPIGPDTFYQHDKMRFYRPGPDDDWHRTGQLLNDEYGRENRPAPERTNIVSKSAMRAAEHTFSRFWNEDGVRPVALAQYTSAHMDTGAFCRSTVQTVSGDEEWIRDLKDSALRIVGTGMVRFERVRSEAHLEKKYRQMLRRRYPSMSSFEV